MARSLETRDLNSGSTQRVFSLALSSRLAAVIPPTGRGFVRALLIESILGRDNLVSRIDESRSNGADPAPAALEEAHGV